MHKLQYSYQKREGQKDKAEANFQTNKFKYKFSPAKKAYIPIKTYSHLSKFKLQTQIEHGTNQQD